MPMNQAEWIYGLGADVFRRSLPGDRYLKAISGRNFREHRSVRHSGTASRYTVVFRLPMRRFPGTDVFTMFVEKYPRWVNKYNTSPMSFNRVSFFNSEGRLSVL